MMGVRYAGGWCSGTGHPSSAGTTKLRRDEAMHYLRTYAGPDGESHFADLEATMLPVEFVPGRPLVDLSTAIPTTASALARLPAGWEGAYHPSPRRQFV